MRIRLRSFLPVSAALITALVMSSCVAYGPDRYEYGASYGDAYVHVSNSGRHHPPKPPKHKKPPKPPKEKKHKKKKHKH